MRAQGARELWINEVLRSSRCLEKLDKVIDDMLAGSIFNLIPRNCAETEFGELGKWTIVQQPANNKQACVFSMLFTLMMSPSFDVTSSCNGQVGTGDEYHGLP